MIQCPECGKEIADNSAHCGFCGAEIQTGGGKKTMIGFAAVTEDAMREAAQQARDARDRAEQEANPPQSSDEGGGEPKLKLPKPGLSAPKSSSASGPASGSDAPKFSIPKPGGGASQAPPDAKTEAMPPVRGPGQGASPDDTVPDQPPEIDATSDTEPGDFGAAPPEPEPSQQTPRFDDAVEASGPPVNTPPTLDEGDAFSSTPADDDWGEPPADPTLPEVASEHGEGPTEFGGGAAPGGGPMVSSDGNLPEKAKKNPVVIAAIAGAALLLFCCIASTIISFFL